MPIYQYECTNCKKIRDKFFHVKDFPKSIKCSNCGEHAKKIITAGGGIITDNNALWLPSVIDQMKPDYETQPVETRQEFKRYLSSHGLVWTG